MFVSAIGCFVPILSTNKATIICPLLVVVTSSSATVVGTKIVSTSSLMGWVEIVVIVVSPLI